MEYKARPAWRNQWAAFIIAAFFLLVLIGALIAVQQSDAQSDSRVVVWFFVGLFGLIVLIIIYRHFSWTYFIDEKVIESRRGIIGLDIQSIRVKDLRNVNIRQSFFQRIFGVGDVEFSSAGGSGIEVAFRGITQPRKIRDMVHSWEDNES